MPDRTLQIIMKRNYPKLLLLVLGMTAFQGCIAFPPLIQVEHKNEPPPPASNEEVIKRLDAIDQRLNSLETKQAKP